MRYFWIGFLCLLAITSVIIVTRPGKQSRDSDLAIQLDSTAPIDPVANDSTGTSMSAETEPGQEPDEPGPTEELVRDLLQNKAEDTEPLKIEELDGPTLQVGMDQEIPHVTVIPGLVQEDPEGSLVADNKWMIRGNGLPDDPYIVSWELLQSAAQTYQPRYGDHDMPQRVALLNGKWIRINGYVAFPLMAAQSKELLAMLNQWDGCCIGVPPTPYDAIEVMLTDQMATGRKHAIKFGRLEGRFKIEPYLIEDWLVGLYMLDDASIEMGDQEAAATP